MLGCTLYGRTPASNFGLPEHCDHASAAARIPSAPDQLSCSAVSSSAVLQARSIGNGDRNLNDTSICDVKNTMLL